MTAVRTPLVWDPEAPDFRGLPDHTQLPDSDGAVNDFLEHPQSTLLTGAVFPVLQRLFPDGDFLIGQDCGIYYRPTDPPLQGCKAPDWFVVRGVPPLLHGRPRRSYVLWHEHERPYVVIEYVSGDGSEERDRTPLTGKFWAYERAIVPAFYAIYQAASGQLEVFRMAGGRFERMTPNERGHYPLPDLEVELGLWQGVHMGMDLSWLRFFDLEGTLLPTPEERTEQERQRAERLAEMLRAAGIDPDRPPS